MTLSVGTSSNNNLNWNNSTVIPPDCKQNFFSTIDVLFPPNSAIHQVNALPQYKTISLQKTIDEALFKIFQFFVRLFNKYFVRYNSYVQ